MMPKPKKSKPPQVEQSFTQSQTPWADPDTPIQDPGTLIPRPMTFEEMVYTEKVKCEPIFDMDTDLGA